MRAPVLGVIPEVRVLTAERMVGLLRLRFNESF